MTETFICDDKDTLVAYLYGEISVEGRREVDRHLRACTGCAEEVDELRALRTDLAAWVPPEIALNFAMTQQPATVLRPSRWAALGEWPAWARAVAALFVLGVGAAIANLQVRYDASGLTVTTGWMAPQGSATPVITASGVVAPSDQWRVELAAVEQSLRREMRQRVATAAETAPQAAARRGTGDDAALIRRVQSLIDASERRQREEMAVRLTQTARDWNMQRQGDLLRIQQGLDTLQGRTSKAEAGQREMVNYVNFLRKSTQPIP